MRAYATSCSDREARRDCVLHCAICRPLLRLAQGEREPFCMLPQRPGPDILVVPRTPFSEDGADVFVNLDSEDELRTFDLYYQLYWRAGACR